MGQGPAVVPTHKINPQMLKRWWLCCEVHTCSAQYPVLPSFFCIVCSRSLRQGHFYFAVSLGFALVNTYIWAQPLATQRFTDKMPPSLDNIWWLPWSTAFSPPRGEGWYQAAQLLHEDKSHYPQSNKTFPCAHLNNNRDSYYHYLKEIYSKLESRIYIFGKKFKINIANTV